MIYGPSSLYSAIKGIDASQPCSCTHSDLAITHARINPIHRRILTAGSQVTLPHILNIIHIDPR